jgi:hypothetical protein
MRPCLPDPLVLLPVTLLNSDISESPRKSSVWNNECSLGPRINGNDREKVTSCELGRDDKRQCAEVQPALSLLPETTQKGVKKS